MQFRIFNGAIYSIQAAALLLGAAGLLSRILGIFRDRLLAAHFGAGRELDIYYAAFQIPDFLYTLFLLGAGSAAIIPIFMELREKSEAESKQLISSLLGIFGIGAIVIIGAAIVLAPYLIPFLTPGFNEKEQRTVIMLTRLMMASPLLLGFSSIVSSVIQSLRYFFVFALSSIFYNLGIIAGIIIFLPFWGLPGLALGVVLGATLHLLVQLPLFAKLGFLSRVPDAVRSLYRNTSGVHRKGIMGVIKLSFPRVIALGINNATMILLVAFASTLAAGSITVLQFANNLRSLPIGIFGVSFSVAAFPALSEYFVRRDGRAFFETFWGTMRSILFWVMPLGVFFYVLRAQIVRVALGAGKFDWGDTRLTAAALGLLSVALIVESFIPHVIKSFYAIENTRKPLFINICFSVLTLALSLFFIQVFRDPSHMVTRSLTALLRVDDLHNVAILGIACAVSVSAMGNLFFLIHAFRREAGKKLREGNIGYYPNEVLTIIFSSLFAGMISFGMLRLANLFVSLDTFLGVLFQGSLSLIAGFLAYGTLLWFLGNREIRGFLETARRRLIHPRILPREFDGQQLK